MLSNEFHKDLPSHMASQLRARLGRTVKQSRLAPELSYGRHCGPPAHDARSAAVIILFYMHRQTWHIPLIVRPQGTGAHAGQIGLPGGVVEPGESSRQAAVRELEEELGITDERIQHLGSLPPTYVFVTNFWVTPHLAVIDTRPNFIPNAEEVADVLEVPVCELVEPAACGQQTIERRGLAFSAPHYSWQGHQIWGATSVMLEEMLALLK